MTVFYQTKITDVGPEVAELIEGGVLILYAVGAPPELAEVSVLHKVETGPTVEAPPVGAELRIGDVSAALTAIGELAWKKVADIGHVVINFDGADTAGRPGELCASKVDAAILLKALAPGAAIAIRSAA
ncbi:PTS glucitol/sorbitol transporter subunit IIA [Microvirga sp. 17 mud 1-3]|uniref:PTS glucitol/sorbitol transporter subunit IIA n=1 Tax=Microvirga sp. 17 mud 1-3 TaxID=2082949 RepID=UPI000D6BBFEF|nr:PTS glucitol/sorbitol transporter subunit IIA [Microvirga sp. 17 mud 1-3]AWM86517.1 PTS cellobiose transporter subunit IIB [Microvirga sp. 17 mud 1-3]